ncbi:hypothetical protein OMAG_001456, partial [Candidatus Omnitrophus magneticus]
MDIVFSNNWNDTSVNINSYIYWGAATGPYSTKTELATSGARGNSIADLNTDGYPDIVFSNYHNGSTRNINSYIYWGASSGPYSTKTELATIGATGNSIADLNNDGYLDIVFSNNWNDTSGNINSYIYWGAATGPYSTKTELATSGAYGVSIAGSNIFGNESGYTGNVIPLWATQGGYSWGLLTSPEYQLVAVKNEQLNSG